MAYGVWGIRGRVSCGETARAYKELRKELRVESIRLKGSAPASEPDGLRVGGAKRPVDELPVGVFSAEGGFAVREDCLFNPASPEGAKSLRLSLAVKNPALSARSWRGSEGSVLDDAGLAV